MDVNVLQSKSESQNRVVNMFFNSILLLAVIILSTWSTMCCANQLNFSDINILLNIVNDANPSLLKIVHDETIETTRILNRLVHHVSDNQSHFNNIPIDVDTFERNYTDLLQNYTTLTVVLAANNDEEKIEAILSNIDPRIHRKHLNKYLVVFVTTLNNSDNKEWTERIFKRFWERRILDVVILYHQECTSMELKSFNPFVSTPEISIVSHAVDSTANELYATKLLNLNGHVFNVFAFEVVFILVRKMEGNGFDGVDGNLIEFLGQK